MILLISLNNQVKIQRQDLEQQQRLNDSLSNDSAYVDPLDFMERKTAQNQEVQEAIADAHDKLMAKTGGQAVEEDLGGWLLVFTLVLIFCVIFLAFDLGMSIVSLKSDPTYLSTSWLMVCLFSLLDYYYMIFSLDAIH